MIYNIVFNYYFRVNSFTYQKKVYFVMPAAIHTASVYSISGSQQEAKQVSNLHHLGCMCTMNDVHTRRSLRTHFQKGIPVVKG